MVILASSVVFGIRLEPAGVDPIDLPAHDRVPALGQRLRAHVEVTLEQYEALRRDPQYAQFFDGGQIVALVAAPEK